MPAKVPAKAPLARMKIGEISAAVCGFGLLAAFAAAPLALRGDFIRTAIGDLVPMVIIAATVIIALRNAFDSRGPTRLFWGLLSLAMTMWCLNLAAWAWFEVWQRRAIPDPYFGDIILFLHVVPIMAAVSLRPQTDSRDEGTLSSMLNVGMLLVWWMAVYAFIVLPDEYVVKNEAVYSTRWDLLYLVEGLIMIALSGRALATSRGAWRKLHGSLLVANVAYSVASIFINTAIRTHTYRSGGIWDIPFLASVLCFFWVTLSSRWRLAELQAEVETAPAANPESEEAIGKQRIAPFLARLAMLSLPCMGDWALFMSDAPARIRQVRFEVAIGGVAILMFFVFLKQHLLDRRLMQLLRESRRSYENLHRLQGRVIQQEKLASLGELVSLGATELQYPLSAVLDGAEALAGNSRLKADQLVMAKKIGAQARRTRDLVQDLLSFAQQVPGEKISLEVKPLVQRAVQMEGFKVQNREIQIEIKSEEQVPRVLGNGNQLLQAFLQVVENALDALQQVGRGRLSISLRCDTGDVLIEFADNGPGLRDPERVFDPFYTTKPVGKGTGLGLSAAYGVILDHKGQITCHNAADGGAVFEVRLPAMKSTTSKSHKAAAH
jgi:signal transduction histidine kinase